MAQKPQKQRDAAEDGAKAGGAAKTIGLMALLIMAAKFMGLLRETMVANIYGQGMESDMINTATQIPLLFFDMVLGVAILSTFVPIFNRCLEREGRDSAMAFANNFVTVVGTIAMGAALLGVLFAKPLVLLMVPGYAQVPGKVEQTARLLRVLFPSIVFTAMAYIAVGILQSFGEFTIPSLISVVSNGVMILYLALMGDRWGLTGVAASMLVAWALQLVIQLPCLKKFGYRYRFHFDLRDRGIRDAALIALPVLISSWVQPLCNVINMSFGSSLGDGAVSALNWGNKIYIIMVGVFAYAITNFIFPKLSRLSSRDNQDGFVDMTRMSVGWAVFIIALVSALFLALANPIIRLVFQRGAFTAEATAITATALRYYSYGMVGYAICEVLNKSFYAISDGKTPMLTSLLGIGVNFGCAALFVGVLNMQVAGLALAGAVSSLVIAAALLVMINRRRKGVVTTAFVWNLVKVALCAGAAWAAAAGLYRITGSWGDSMVMTVARLAAASLPAALVYGALAFVLRVEELQQAVAKLKRRS